MTGEPSGELPPIKPIPNSEPHKIIPPTRPEPSIDTSNPDFNAWWKQAIKLNHFLSPEFTEVSEPPKTTGDFVKWVQETSMKAGAEIRMKHKTHGVGEHNPRDQAALLISYVQYFSDWNKAELAQNEVGAIYALGQANAVETQLVHHHGLLKDAQFIFNGFFKLPLVDHSKYIQRLKQLKTLNNFWHDIHIDGL